MIFRFREAVLSGSLSTSLPQLTSVLTSFTPRGFLQRVLQPDTNRDLGEHRVQPHRFPEEKTRVLLDKALKVQGLLRKYPAVSQDNETFTAGFFQTASYNMCQVYYTT